MMKTVLLRGSFCALWILPVFAASAQPVRLAPDALQQDGKITLSPGFSPDGRTLYFTQSECAPIWACPQRLKRSEYSEGQWTTPQEVPLPEGFGSTVARVDFPSVTPDGTALLFSWSALPQNYVGRDIDENFDLYRLDLTRTDAVPVPLKGPDVNRIREGRVKTLRYVNNENAPVITEAGDLYFWAERLDGPGRRDIYRARPDGVGGFERPEALAAPINTELSDDASWVHPSGRLILLNTQRNGLGLGNIYVSTRRGDIWSDPVSLGPAANSKYSDFAGRITPDGQNLVFTSNRPVHEGEDWNSELYQVWTVPVAEVDPLKEALARIDMPH